MRSFPCSRKAPGQCALHLSQGHRAEVHPAAVRRQPGGLLAATGDLLPQPAHRLRGGGGAGGQSGAGGVHPGGHPGLSLKDSLFTPEETKKIILQLCGGLWVLHSMAAVHRDIKPGNVILRGNDAILIDFDAARLHKAENDTDTQVLGTTGFAAPEKYGLSQSDIRTDIYSLGILINVMLTGEHPSKRQAVGHLGRVVGRCTYVNPQKRYKNVRKLMEAL